MERQDYGYFDLYHWLGLNDLINPTKKPRHHHQHRQRGKDNGRTVERVRTVDKTCGIIDQLEIFGVKALVYINPFDPFRQRYQSLSNELSKMVRYFPLLWQILSLICKRPFISIFFLPHPSQL
jgi:hypothetical protein